MNAFNKILVTGGAGFIGSHTVDSLLRQGKKVIVFDNFSTGKLSNLDLFNPNLTVIQADVLDFNKLSQEVARVDAVLHLAALSSVPLSVEDPIYSLKCNTQGFLHVLEAIRHAGKPIRLVYASSAAVYGDATHLPCDDTFALESEPLSPYALEKTTIENYANLYTRLFGIKSIGLRYFNVYGPRQDPKSAYSGVISKFMQQYQNNEPITVLGDGYQSRDFIYVDDVVKANFLALNSNEEGQVNIATGTAETLLNLIACIEALDEKKILKLFLPARLGDIRNSYANVEKAKKILLFHASISLKEGINKMQKLLTT